MDRNGRRPIPARIERLPPAVIRLLDAAAAVYFGVLLYATHHPKPQNLLGPTPPNDKLLHLFAYGALGGIVATALAARGGWKTPRSGAAVFVPLSLFAAIDESTQPFFGRSADQVDWAYDGIGLLMGIAAVTTVVVSWNRRAA